MSRVMIVVKCFVVFILLAQPLAVQAKAKVIGIIVWDGVLTSDVTAPLEVFGQASQQSWFNHYEVKLIALDDRKSITTHEGLRLGVDASILNMPAAALDVVLIPSAYEMEPIVENARLIRFVQQAAGKASWIASNCSGAWVLAEAGLLDGKKATTWAGGEHKLQKAYPQLRVQHNTNVVVDGSVITSNGGTVSYQAALTLLAKLSSPRLARQIGKALQIQRVSGRHFINAL